MSHLFQAIVSGLLGKKLQCISLQFKKGSFSQSMVYEEHGISIQCESTCDLISCLFNTFIFNIFKSVLVLISIRHFLTSRIAQISIRNSEQIMRKSKTQPNGYTLFFGQSKVKNINIIYESLEEKSSMHFFCILRTAHLASPWYMKNTVYQFNASQLVTLLLLHFIQHIQSSFLNNYSKKQKYYESLIPCFFYWTYKMHISH